MYYDQSRVLYNKGNEYRCSPNTHSYTLDPMMREDVPSGYYHKAYGSASYRMMTITLSTFARAWGSFRAKVVMAAEVPGSKVEKSERLRKDGTATARSHAPFYIIMAALLSWFHFTLNILILRTLVGLGATFGHLIGLLVGRSALPPADSTLGSRRYDPKLGASTLDAVATRTLVEEDGETGGARELSVTSVESQDETDHCPPLSSLSLLRLRQVRRKVLVLDLDETLIHSYHENNILWRQQQTTSPIGNNSLGSAAGHIFNFLFPPSSNSPIAGPQGPSTCPGNDIVTQVGGATNTYRWIPPQSGQKTSRNPLASIFQAGRPACGFKSGPALNVPPLPTKAPDFVLRVMIDRHPVRFFIYKRPYVDYFLRMVSQWYDLVVYTASMEIYGSGVADQLDQPSYNLSKNTSSSCSCRSSRETVPKPAKKNAKDLLVAGDGGGLMSCRSCCSSNGSTTILGRRYYRQHCKLEPGGTFSKDLSQVHADLSSVLILDNSPAAYRGHPDNGIPVKSWFSDPDDRNLLDLLPFLDALRFVDDVRSVLARNTHALRPPPSTTPCSSSNNVIGPSVGISCQGAPKTGTFYYHNNLGQSLGLQHQPVVRPLGSNARLLVVPNHNHHHNTLVQPRNR